MRTLEGSNRVRNGLMGILILVIVIGVGQSFASVPMLFAKPTYYAEFSDTGGINNGDKVRISGVDVGKVQSMVIEGDKVKIGYSLDGTQIGTDSRAAIRTDTILGRRNIEIEPRGTDVLRPSGVLPLGQTTTPYQIYDAFFDVTEASSGWDTETVKRSLNVLSETIDQTYPHLSAALDGVARFSDTIGKRDDDVKHLLANANKIAGILGNRSEQINKLLVNAQSLLAAINERNYAVSQLLERVGAFSDQVKGFIDDNPNLNRVLEQLRVVSDVLNERRFDLMDTLTTVASFVASLGEAVASGPYFKVMLVNLLPGQILQPFVDAAFKKRGIDPEKFWGDAGLPAWRFPDPNAARFENGAPAPGPAILEGTPEHPGPAVLKGYAVFVHARGSRRSAEARRPTAVFALERRPLRRPRIRPARRRHVGPERARPWIHARCARRGDPGSTAAGHARRPSGSAAGTARCPHRARGPVASRGAGLHARHRAAAAGVDRTAASARTRARTQGPRAHRRCRGTHRSSRQALSRDWDRGCN